MKILEAYERAIEKSEFIFSKYFLKRNGPYQKLFSTGEVEIEGKYKNGMKQGHWKYFYQNGKIKKEGDYNLGLRNGEWIYNYENGSIETRVVRS